MLWHLRKRSVLHQSFFFMWLPWSNNFSFSLLFLLAIKSCPHLCWHETIMFIRSVVSSILFQNSEMLTEPSNGNLLQDVFLVKELHTHVVKVTIIHKLLRQWTGNAQAEVSWHTQHFKILNWIALQYYIEV